MIKSVSVVIPAFNEEEGIVSVIEEVEAVLASLEIAHEIVVVNDGSEDDTAKLVQAFEKEGVRLIEHAVNRGYGAALKSGIREARFGTIVVVDADCTYPTGEIPKLLEGMVKADMVVGARIGKGVNMEAIRRPPKWFLRKLASWLSGSDIKDLNSGLRAFRKDLAEKYFHLLPNKFSFTTTITLAMLADGYKVDYVPIEYYGREGRSKIRWYDAWNFFVLILKTILYFNPLKVFIPPTIVIGVIGLAKLYYDVFIISDVGDSSIFLLLFSFQLFTFGVLADLIVKRT